MSVFPQHKYPLRSLNHVHSCLRRCPVDVLRVTCSATTKPRLNQSQLVVEPRIEMSPDQLVSPASPPLLNDPSLQSTWSHWVWLASGCATVMFSLTKAIVGAASSYVWLEPVLAGYVAYILSDLGSGIYHWGIDNYGDASTPVFGAQIEAFQGHHKWPWTITRRQFANNLHALARAITLSVLPIDLLCNNPIVHGFVALCSGCILFGQQLHAGAHGTKSKLPPLLVALQDVGVLVSLPQHSAYHRPPYNNNYCIVSGVWNQFLDKHKVFEALQKLDVRPGCWSKPSTEWTEDTETASQVAVQ